MGAWLDIPLAAEMAGVSQTAILRAARRKEFEHRVVRSTGKTGYAQWVFRREWIQSWMRTRAAIDDPVISDVLHMKPFDEDDDGKWGIGAALGGRRRKVKKNQ